MAQEELTNVRKASSSSGFEDAWYRFLVSANAVDGIIGSSARCKRSTPWYGRKKNLRRRDPLLAYMHQARNVDEHGIAPVIEYVPESLEIGRPDEAVHIKHMQTDSRGQIISLELLAVDGRLPTVEYTAPHMMLTPVVDERFGDKFPPPTAHLGKPLSDTSPHGVGLVWLGYLESLVDEAEAFAT